MLDLTQKSELKAREKEINVPSLFNDTPGQIVGGIQAGGGNLLLGKPDGTSFVKFDGSTVKVSGDISGSIVVPAAGVGQAEMRIEVASLAFGSADVTKTASVTSGSIILGVYTSDVTSTPAYGELKLGVSGTTLTGTRSAAPGGTATITYTVRLLKV